MFEKDFLRVILARFEASPVRFGAVGEDTFFQQLIYQSQGEWDFWANDYEVDLLRVCQCDKPADIVGCNWETIAILCDARIARRGECAADQGTCDARIC